MSSQPDYIRTVLREFDDAVDIRVSMIEAAATSAGPQTGCPIIHERWRDVVDAGKTSFTCDAGLIHLVLPIVVHDNVAGCLATEHLAIGVSRRMNSPAAPLASADERRRRAKVVAPESLKGVTRLLHATATEIATYLELGPARLRDGALGHTAEVLRDVASRYLDQFAGSLAADALYLCCSPRVGGEVVVASIDAVRDLPLPEAWSLSGIVGMARSGEARFLTGTSAGAGNHSRASWAALPISSPGGMVVGMLVAAYRDGRSIENDYELRSKIQLLARQAGIRLENAFLKLQLKQGAWLESEAAIVGRAKVAGSKLLRDLAGVVAYRSASLQLVRGDDRTLLVGEGFDDQSFNRSLLLPITQDQLIASIIRSGRPLILEDPTTDPNWDNGPSTKDVRSWIGLPIYYEGRPIALFTIDHDTPGFFDQSLFEPLLTFAATIASEVWHVWLWDSAEQRTRDMEIIGAVTSVLDAKLDADELLQAVADQITERLRCTHCTIFLPDPADGTVLAARGAAGGRQTLTRRFRVGEGLVGDVFASGRAVVLADARKDPRFAAPRQGEQRPRSMLLAPIKAGARTIGVISADQDEFGWFADSDRRLLETMGQQVGTAIQRSLGLALLQDVAKRIIASNSLEDVLREVISGAILLIRASTGVIHLLGEDAESPQRSFHPPGFSHPPPRLDRPDGLTRTVMESGSLILIRDIALDPRVNPDLIERFRAMMVVPLKLADAVIGVLYLNDDRVRDFTEVEVSLVRTLAAQAAIAIQKVRVSETQRTISRLLDEAFERLSDDAAARDDALRRVADNLLTFLGRRVTVSISLYDKHTNSFDPFHSVGSLSGVLKLAPRDNGPSWHLLQTRSPLYLSDVSAPPPGCPSVRRESIDAGVVSFAALPLIRRQEFIGALFVHAEKRLDFDDELKRVLSIFCSVAGAAIDVANYHVAADINGAMVKAADVGFLASGIAHEFANHLNNLRTTVDELKQSETIQETSRLLGTCRTEIDRAVKSIDTFRGNREPADVVSDVDLHAIVAELYENQRVRAGQNGITVDVSGVPPGTMARVNGSLVRSMLINLLRNAMDAVENSTGQRRVAIEITHDDTRLEIAVSDSGPGINQADIPKLFIPYFTTKGGGGMGIGLFLVQGIVRKLGGRIHVVGRNAMGGATFRVSLPAMS